MTITATPKKLRSGEWGATVQSDQVTEGDTITITTRAGKTWTATVAQVIWAGDGVSIVATARTAKSTPQTGRMHRPDTRYQAGAKCWECGHRGHTEDNCPA